MNKNFVAYRYPGDGEKCHFAIYEDNDIVLTESFMDIGSRSCFVFAPFKVSDTEPIVMFCNKTANPVTIRELRQIFNSSIDCDKSTKQKFRIKKIIDNSSDYHEDFECFHSAVCTGDLRKVVLARSSQIHYDGAVDILELFAKACNNYPNSFVTLVNSNVSGMWLVATPEILCEKTGNSLHTISLAGTMNLSDKIEEHIENGEPIAKIWSKKNIKEQELVSFHIENVLRNISNTIDKSKPKTVRAGNLVHIRTDFNLSLDHNISIGEVLQVLHPTPAVCGYPVEKAMQIIGKEHSNRKYYSGFCGSVDPEKDTRVFVTLRCMQLHANNKVELYAGGGILQDSNEYDEWNETVYKMQTILKCLMAQ